MYINIVEHLLGLLSFDVDIPSDLTPLKLALTLSLLHIETQNSPN